MERRLAAILAADVVGYSRLMGEDEAGTHEALMAHRQELIDPATASHNGRIVKSTGDGVLAEFASVVDAVTCALELQKEMNARNAGVPDDRRIALRIGINLGDVIVEGDDIYGDGVNLASRLEGIAEPGGICISEMVHQEVEKKLDLEFAYLGELQVKNFVKPVRTYAAVLGNKRPVAPKGAKFQLITQGQLFAAAVIAIALIGSGVVAWLKPWTTDLEPAAVERMAFPLPDKPSIAVLPFANMSGDPEQDYFADGMTEDLITDLSKISGLFVIARNSTFTYKGKTVTIRQVAEELGVRYVLEGSVRRAGDQVRINAQFIDATTGGHLWAERYDGTLADVFALQDKVTESIVTALHVNLTAAERERQARKETDSPEAYDAVLKGWAHYWLYTPEDLAKAISYFEEALQLDPNYGRPHAALATVYWDIGLNYWMKSLGMSYAEVREKAVQHLEEALKDPTPLAHRVAARIWVSDERWDEAIAEAERAIALDANDPDGYVAKSNVLVRVGRPAEGLEFIQKAMRLDPQGDYLWWLGHAQFHLERYDEAAATLLRATENSPGDLWAFLLLAAAYGQLGRVGEAKSAIDTFNKIRAEVRGNARTLWPMSTTGISRNPLSGNVCARACVRLACRSERNLRYRTAFNIVRTFELAVRSMSENPSQK